MASIQSLVSTIESSIKGKQLFPATLLLLIVSAIESTKQFTQLSGVDKKTAVEQALTSLINQCVSEPTLKAFIMELIPPTIDIAISLSKQKFNINAIKSKCTGCWDKKKK
jgi:hypothetical protein